MHNCISYYKYMCIYTHIHFMIYRHAHTLHIYVNVYTYTYICGIHTFFLKQVPVLLIRGVLTMLLLDRSDCPGLHMEA